MLLIGLIVSATAFASSDNHRFIKVGILDSFGAVGPFARVRDTSELLDRIKAARPRLFWVTRTGSGPLRWFDPRVADHADFYRARMKPSRTYERLIAQNTAGWLGETHPLIDHPVAFIETHTTRAKIFELLVGDLIEGELASTSGSRAKVIQSLIQHGPPPADPTSAAYARYAARHGGHHFAYLYRASVQDFDAARYVIDARRELHLSFSELEPVFRRAEMALSMTAERVHWLWKTVEAAQASSFLSEEEYQRAAKLTELLPRVHATMSAGLMNLLQTKCAIRLGE